ncbi:MAG: hypothetical protein RL441_841 [Actinomycetota bacterium]|jgi:ribosomal protein S18 acetylase RimI-like enzyme
MMQPITDRIAFAPHVGKYVRAAVPIESFLLGWVLPAGSAVLIDNGRDWELIIEGEATALDYARMLAGAAEAGYGVNTATLPFELGQHLNNPEARDWYWMMRERPFGVVAMPPHIRVIRSNEFDSEIGRFLQLASPDTSVTPGNPEIQFWVLSRAADGSLQAAAAGTKWSSGAHVINAVAVAPSARRHGLGSIVTLLAAQQHFADGAKAVALGVRGTNHNALQMYRKLGFDVEMHFSSVRLSRREQSEL